MATFIRFRPVISGFVGAPGINTWHGSQDILPINASQAQQFADEVRVCYEAMKAYFVSGVTISFPGEVTVHDESTGELMTVHGITAPAGVSSTGSGATSNTTRDMQYLARLNTNTTRDGKRLNGRHFIGPANTSGIDTAGQVTSALRGGIAAAYGGLLDLIGPNLYVWGPPKRNEVGTIISPGALARVVSVSVSAVPGTLRSRKT